MNKENACNKKYLSDFYQNRLQVNGIRSEKDRIIIGVVFIIIIAVFFGIKLI